MTRWAAIGLVLLAGCVPVQPPVDLNDGYTHIGGGGTFDCGRLPVAVDGSRRDVVLQNGCTRVRVTGSHDDLTVYVEPGAAIEVTGIRDTVVYRLVRRGAAPQWIDRGVGNELLRNSRAPWERDHDWYQEQH